MVSGEEINRSRDQFVGEPMAESWRPVEVAVFVDTRRDAHLPPSDFPSLGGLALVFSARAVEALADLLEGRGELLPLACEEGEYHGFNVTRLSDALDEERSEFKYFSDREIMDIERYEFVPERLAGETIFKLPQIPEMYEYVTDPLVERVREQGLTGFAWDRKVWSGPEQRVTAPSA